MASMGMEKKGKQQESKRDLGGKPVIWREAEALGKQSLVFEAKAWRSRGPELQHSPGAGTAQEQFPGAPTQPYHSLSCSQHIPHPALLQPCPKAGLARGRASHRGHQGCSPSQDTTAHTAKIPFSPNPLLFKAQHTGAGLGSSGKLVWMSPKQCCLLIPTAPLFCAQADRGILTEGAVPRSEQNFY